MAVLDDEEDQNLASFLESEILSEVSDQEELEMEDGEESKAKRRRLKDEVMEVEEKGKGKQFGSGNENANCGGLVTCRSCISKSIESGIFTKIPPEIFPHILKFLSSEDLIACSLVCRFLNYAASDETLWRRLYRMRWGLLPSTKQLSECVWKKLYIQRDEEDMIKLVRNCPPEFKEYYFQMNAAKRSEAPLPSTVRDDNVVLDKTVADQISVWKRSRGLSDKVVEGHTCSGETCSYYHVGDVFVCEKTGNIHVCDDTCRETVIDSENSVFVCTVSGHCFDRFVSSSVLDSEPEDQNGNLLDAEEEPFMGSGRFARAYSLGYNCEDEKELEAALRSC